MCLTLRYCMSTKVTAVGVTWPWYRLTNALSCLLSTQADHYLWDCVSDNLWIWPLLTNKWVAWYGFILLPNLCKILFVSFFPTAKDEDKDCGKIFVSVQHSVVTYSQYQVTPSSSLPPSPSLPHPFSPSLLSSLPPHPPSSPQTSNTAGGTIIYIVHKVFKYLLSQWAICFIFSPLKRTPVEGDMDTLSWAGKPVSKYI